MGSDIILWSAITYDATTMNTTQPPATSNSGGIILCIVLIVFIVGYYLGFRTGENWDKRKL